MLAGAFGTSPPPLTLEYLRGVGQEISEKYFTSLDQMKYYPPCIVFGLPKGVEGGPPDARLYPTALQWNLWGGLLEL